METINVHLYRTEIPALTSRTPAPAQYQELYLAHNNKQALQYVAERILFLPKFRTAKHRTVDQTLSWESALGFVLTV